MSSRLYTPPGSRGRVDSRGSARSSASRTSGSDRGSNRGGSPSSSLYSRGRVASPASRNTAVKRSPQVTRARTSPQMQRQSPQNRRPGNAVSRYSPNSRQYSIRTGGKVNVTQTASKGDSDRDESPTSNLSDINARLARLQQLVKATKG